MTKLTPHPQADILRAIADGHKEFESLSWENTWWSTTVDAVLKHIDNPSYKFRTKPKPKIGRYRVALMFDIKSHSWTSISTSHDDTLENFDTFVKWLTDWIEYEIPEGKS